MRRSLGCAITFVVAGVVAVTPISIPTGVPVARAADARVSVNAFPAAPAPAGTVRIDGQVRALDGTPVSGRLRIFDRLNSSDVGDDLGLVVPVVDGAFTADVPATAMIELTFLPTDGVGFRFTDPSVPNLPPDPTTPYVLTLPEPGSITGAALLGPGVQAPAGSIVHIEHGDVPLNDTDAREVTAPTLGLIATTEVQSDGTFAFPSVWPGDYRVWWQDPATERGFTGPNPAGQQNPRRALWPVRAATVTQMTIMRPPGSVAGFVTRDGQPVPGLSVEVVRLPEYPNFFGPWDFFGRVKTDGDGHYSLPGLEPGDYQVIVLDEACPGARGAAVTVETSAVDDADVQLTHASVHLTRPAVEQGFIESVTLPRIGAAGRPWSTTVTDWRLAARSDLTFCSVPPGTFEIWFNSEATGGFDVLGAQSIVIDASTTGVDVAIPVPRVGGMSGRLTGLNGEPLAYRTIRLRQLVGTAAVTATTDAAGNFSWEVVPEGDYEVSAVYPTADNKQPYATDPVAIAVVHVSAGVTAVANLSTVPEPPITGLPETR